MIFLNCKYTDLMNISNVCKKWKKILLNFSLKKEYEKSYESYLAEKKKFAKNYEIAEYFIDSNKNSFIARNLESKKKYKIEVIRMENAIDSRKILKKLHFLHKFNHPFFPILKDFLISSNEVNIITNLKYSLSLYEINQSLSLEGKKKKNQSKSAKK